MTRSSSITGQDDRFPATEKKAGERSGGVTAPTPTTSAHGVGGFKVFQPGAQGTIYRGKRGRNSRKAQCFQEKHRGRNTKRRK